MRVLVTGATGFIGLALTKSLYQKNYSVIAVVRRAKDSLISNIEQVLMGNLLPNIDWGPTLDNIDTLIHLAARAHIVKEKSIDPLTDFREINARATLNLAQQAAKSGVCRFIFISSIGVNGNQTLDKPFTIEDMPHSTEPYALSKHEAEIGLRQIAAETGMEVVIIRPPLVYGPNAKGNFRQLMHWMNQNIPLPLGAIHNQRSFVAIDNLVDLITLCIEHPAAANQTFLVSDDEDLSTTELLQRLGKVLGKSPRLLPVPQGLLENGLKLIGKGDIAQRLLGNLQIDICETKELLGWAPPVSVDEGLRKTAEWYLKQQ